MNADEWFWGWVVGRHPPKCDDSIGLEGVRTGVVDEHSGTIAHPIPLPQLLLTA